MPDLNSLSEAWNSPPTRHAMFVHTPIVLAMIGVVLALLSAILAKNRTLSVLAIACQAALILATYFTLNSGEQAEHAITAALSTEVSDLIHEHEEMAEKIWFFAGGVLAVLALATGRRHSESRRRTGVQARRGNASSGRTCTIQRHTASNY
jgi:hypothetical protein